MCVKCSGTGREYKEVMGGVWQVNPCSCAESEAIREMKRKQWEELREMNRLMMKEYRETVGI